MRRRNYAKWHRIGYTRITATDSNVIYRQESPQKNSIHIQTEVIYVCITINYFYSLRISADENNKNSIIPIRSDTVFRALTQNNVRFYAVLPLVCVIGSRIMPCFQLFPHIQQIYCERNSRKADSYRIRYCVGGGKPFF